MFYYLKGEVVYTEPNLVVIDVGGVGYQMMSSINSSSKVRPGEKAVFYTHLNVREDAVELFGFYDREELACFKQLISVSGVGPKMALSLLSALTPQRIALAIATEDVQALTAAQGVGKKLAQRIAMELKDKITAAAGDDIPSGAPLSVKDSGVRKDALDALVVLGYTRSKAEAALAGVDTTAMAVDEIVRIALKKLY